MARAIRIPINAHYELIADAADRERLAGLTWYIAQPRPGGRIYAMTRLKGRTVYAHRLVVGEPRGLNVIPRNRNGPDVRRKNLVVATKSQHAADKTPTRAKVGLRGVDERNSGRFTARICRRALGTFDTAAEAAAAFDAAATQRFGSFARLNFPAAE